MLNVLYCHQLVAALRAYSQEAKVVGIDCVHCLWPERSPVSLFLWPRLALKICTFSDISHSRDPTTAMGGSRNLRKGDQCFTFLFSASEMTYIVSSGALNSTHYSFPLPLSLSFLPHSPLRSSAP